MTANAIDLLIHFGRKDRDAANRYADEALANLSESVQAGTKEFLAGLLMQLKRAADALPIFQELFDSDIPTFDARQLIACADELRLHKKVLEICEEAEPQATTELADAGVRGPALGAVRSR